MPVVTSERFMLRTISSFEDMSWLRASPTAIWGITIGIIAAI